MNDTTREALASLLAALFYGQYATNEDKQSLDDSIEEALKDFDIGEGKFHTTGAPLYAKSFGYSLAAEVIQSDLYHRLNDKARAECDEFIARGHARSALGGAATRAPTVMALSDVQLLDIARETGLRENPGTTLAIIRRLQARLKEAKSADPAAVPVQPDELRQKQTDVMRTALEVIAVGDSITPVDTAQHALIAAGVWSPDPAAVQPEGWKLSVQEDEERSWLRIVSPGGAELAFSSQRGSNGAQLLQDLSIALIGSKS